MQKITLASELSEIGEMGPRFLMKFKKLGIVTVKSLLWHFPTRYEDWSIVSTIAELNLGDSKTIHGIIQEIGIKRTWRKKMIIVEALIADDSGSIRAIWFNQPYIKNILKEGAIASFAGKVALRKNEFYLSNPTYEILNANDKDGETKHTGRLVPIYPETKGLTSKGIRTAIQKVLDNLNVIPEFIPDWALHENNLPEVNKALCDIHFPTKKNDAEKAKRRFAFEELFLLQLKNLYQKIALAKEKAPVMKFAIDDIKEMFADLPFELTCSQKKSLWEILQDLNKARPMNRLLQGDVGSGKTIVAGIATIIVTRNGYQVALMAPTEILARQHYKTLMKFFKNFTEGIGLLVSKEARIFYGDGLETSAKKLNFTKEVASGKIKIIVGTHALIEKNVKFQNLGLVVVDEQHRFGVRQRAELVGRGQTQTDTDNTQTNADHKDNGELLYEDLTYKIRGCGLKIKEKLGLGHKEVIYQKALAEELTAARLQFEQEKQIPVIYEAKKIGVYQPDFIVDGKVIVELKAIPFIGKNEQKQLWTYLKGSPYKLAVLINFSPNGVEFKRVVYDTARINPRLSASGLRKSALMLPHFLSMSATPIPRTIMMTVFGDLDLSVISELPKGRKNIVTKIVDPKNRDKAYAFIRGQVRKGRQIFVICPRIDLPQTNADNMQNYVGSPHQSALLWETKAVKEEYEKLSKKIFPDLRVAMLHGKMKSAEKEKTMSAFADGETDVLVSTSVVEVGVDVPNATIMMIEGAEMFGLAQLYQFRGRVGRGEHQSFCFLFTESSSRTTYGRLHSILAAKNGFELAEKDLKLRGPGEFLGEEQSGMPDVAMRALQNPELIKESRAAAESVLKKDPNLKTLLNLKARFKEFQKEVHLE